jgi:hypothetical protein
MTSTPGYAPYLPLNSLKPVAPDVWIADGPEIRFGFLGIKLPHPTRMTVVKLPQGGLWIHSPIPPAENLLRELEQIGTVHHLIAPNTFHYSWLADWTTIYPGAQCWGPPGLPKSVLRTLPHLRMLKPAPPPDWAGSFDQLLAPGNVLKEVAFFHRASRTLILTDLIENFEASRIRNPWHRRLLEWSGIADQNGAAPLDMRMAFLGHRNILHEAVRGMIDWNPERVILAHGRWFDANGAAELARLFRWVLD